MNVDAVKCGNAEADCFFSAAEARRASTDRPAIHFFIEVARRASGMGHRAFAAELEEAAVFSKSLGEAFPLVVGKARAFFLQVLIVL